jgi:YbbR domain-containing protein
MRDRIRDLFLENWGLKLTSLAIACFLWFVVRGDSGTERVITVPLEIRIPRNMEITNERPSSVDVTIRGLAGNMWFGQTVPVCTIDLQDADEGDHTVPLAERNVLLPRTSGLEIVAIRPTRLRLVLERTTSKEVPVRAVLGDTPPRLDVYSVTLNPAKVVITGPRTHVQGVREVLTENISLEGQQTSFRSFVNLNIRDMALHSTPVGPIEVAIGMGPHRTLQTVSQIPVAVDDESVSVWPPKIAINVLAPPAIGDDLKPDDFIATVNAHSLEDAKKTARVKPDVRFKQPRDPAVVIRYVPEVTLRRPKSGR